MNSNSTTEENEMQFTQEEDIDLLELVRKAWSSRILIFKVCGIGAVIGIIIAFSTPKEYTAAILMAPENIRRSSSSGLSALADMAGVNMSPSLERDAIYPSLYPVIANSTPFLVRLFDVNVHEQKENTPMTLAQYLKERQKSPWWSIITSTPLRLMSWAMSLFREIPKEDNVKTKIDPFQLTREEWGIASAIASRISFDIDQKKRVITLSVTMQDPLVAAIVADTVRVYMQEYVTEYRTIKARKILKYKEKLRNKAQTEYYDAQKKYAGYADVNRGLSMLTSRAELVRLQNEMNLARSTYNQLEQQVQFAKAKVEKVTPVYAIIQPAQVPLGSSKPNKVMIIVGCLFLCAAGSVGWVLFGNDFLRSINKNCL